MMRWNCPHHGLKHLIAPTDAGNGQHYNNAFAVPVWTSCFHTVSKQLLVRLLAQTHLPFLKSSLTHGR